jgi:GT2 family glycosyltransferase
MKADIIIRGKDGHKLLEKLLISLADTVSHNDYRLIVVDDGSNPPLNCPEEDYVVRHGACHGAVSATNSGLALSMQRHDTKFVIIFDNDIQIPAGDTTWLDRWIAEMEAHPDCAAMGATSGAVDAVQHIICQRPTYTADWEGGVKEASPVTKMVSFAVLLRKDAVRQVGLWDERYNPGNYEDTDYALQLREAGWSVRVARSVYIHHECHQTFGDDLKKLMATNQGKFMAKWGVGRLWDLGLVPNTNMADFIRQVERDERKAANETS